MSAVAARARGAWTWRVRELLAAYLPVLLLLLAALGSWWLVKHAPQLGASGTATPPQHVPDYAMSGFMIQRFAADGRLRIQIEGTELRHYPDDDTLEIDGVSLRALSPGGAVTTATARRALSNGDATQVQLLGGAHVVREATEGASAIEFRGEFLEALLDSERVRSHLPVTVQRGATELRADTLDYDNVARVAQLNGRVRGVFPPGAARPAALIKPPAP